MVLVAESLNYQKLRLRPVSYFEKRYFYNFVCTVLEKKTLFRE